MERNGISGFELLVIVGALVVGTIGGAIWLGAWLAAVVGGGRLQASFGDALSAATRLPTNLSNPRLAWPAGVQGALPGPVMYWAVTGLTLVAVLAVAAVLFRLLSRSRVGTMPRRPLGVDSRARFATARDLKPLVVRGAHPGRFLIGRHGRSLLATELPPTGKGRRHRGRRQGDRGAVALIGPSRSGKTTAAITGILEWEGPAVLSSVKADLLAATCGWRKEQGKVLVYDPTHTTGGDSAIWSPLRAANTVLGAQRAARALCEAAPRSDNVKGSLDFWLSQAEILLFGLLYTAARTGKDMARVCEWVMVQDRPREDGLGDVRVALNQLLESEDPIVQDGAARASQAVVSIWEMEEETRSSVYATAQTVVWPWADPGVASASRGKSLSLDWLLGGPNTLYLCAPIEDQERLAPAFGG
ncbi:MAG: type IV secretory system conjugative DNA transfer family protein, partial [Acidimicrobiales bacterium]